MLSTFQMENHGERAGCFMYTRSQLLMLQRFVLLSGMYFNIPEKLLRLYRGCTAESKKEAKRRCQKPFISSISMRNIRSLGN